MSTDRTPIDRAKEALSPSESRATKRTEYGEMSTPILLLSAENAARAAVSAALHDPDDPDALARVIDPEAFGDAAFVPDPRSLVGMVLEGRRATARRRAANLVAAILGEAS